MSNNQQNNSSEEVDLGQLFNAIGNLFQRFFDFIGSIFKAIFSVFIFLLKAVITYFKIIAVVLVVAFVIGYALEKTGTPTYQSEMLVRPNFGSKYKLIDNIDYFNDLIANNNVSVLSNLFEVDDGEAASLITFEIEKGPESELDKLRQYDDFLRTIDTARADEISYKEFLESRDIYASEIYAITAKSKLSTVFGKLEKGIIKSFDNSFAKEQFKKRNEMVAAERTALEASLESIDSIRSAYLAALKSESDNTVTMGEGLKIVSDNQTSKELGLVNREIELRNRLKDLEQNLIEENSIFEIVSGFQQNGTRSSGLSTNYKILFPLIAFTILSLIFLGILIVKFVTTYESK